MKLWVIVLAFFFALFLAAVVAAGALFFLLSSKPSPKPPRPRVVQPQQNGAPRPSPPAPISPPSLNGRATSERWEGYYYSSIESFERVCAKDVQRTRFWIDVRRSADGQFTAECQELSNLGASSVTGRFDPNSGECEFTKTYKEGGNVWNYSGRWNNQYKRVEGTFGERQGGFVLYMRHLARSETKFFERPLNAPPVPKEVVPQQNDPVEAPTPRTKTPKSLPSAEPKNDQF